MSKTGIVPFETTTFVRDTCLCRHVQRAARALGRRFDEALRPVCLTHGQFSLMMSLNRPDPHNMGSVAALLAMDRTTLTAALKPLRRRELVEVAMNPRDRRRRVMKLTAKGCALLAAAVPIWRQAHAEVDRILPAGGGDRLRRDLQELL